MAHFEKHFSVEEARAWIPELRRRFGEIRLLYAELAALRDDFERVQTLIRMNGHAPQETNFESRLVALRDAVQEIMAAGIEIKDIGRGLVDFPHLREGEEVFLCWELGEDDLCFWHRIEDGYPGRQPI